VDRVTLDRTELELCQGCDGTAFCEAHGKS